ncbi:helix-turn-helix domain-containing protein [uncultured Psychroserpens sp.]|uniref:AraC family transcriptional regulator n=1 Tax=uncultured Psychroserpens sp. TaxID=255436 RepID=UPI00261DC748|nr:helix-turn-helix domain-containing protein [uncultured Psychroserpens sp.]
MQQTPSFDTWTSGFLFAVAMGIFLFLILIAKRNKKNYPIAFLVLAFSGILFAYVLYWTKYAHQIPYFNSFQYIGLYSAGPLIYTYVSNIYNVKLKRFIFHFGFSFLWIGLTLIFWSQYLFKYRLDLREIVKFFSNYVLIIMHLIGYLFAIIWLFKKNNTTDTEVQKIRHKWIRVLIVLYALFVLSYISYYILINFSFFNNQWDYMISVSMSLAIYAIGYFVYKEPQIFDGEFISDLFLPIENKKDSLEDHLINELYNNLVQYIETDKPFTDNDLRLANLADQVGYSTHLLSKVINKKSGKNFNHFINDYRLLEAEKLLTSSNSYSVKTIYFDVGFNNKVTFYKAFKGKHNCTPTEYKKIHMY